MPGTAGVIAPDQRVHPAGSRLSAVLEHNSYQSEGLLYLPPGSRYQELLDLPEGADIGARLNDAMGLIEQHSSKLAGVLPRSCNLFTPQLLSELLKRISEIPTDLEFDAFGRIYEYFLGEFARSEGQKGGEFFTPSSLVVLITEIVEPFAGRYRRVVQGGDDRSDRSPGLEPQSREVCGGCGWRRSQR